MQNLVEIRTLIFIITIILVCRAAIMGYVWFIARQYAPVRLWAAGSILMALGAFCIGLRDVIPLHVSVMLGQSLLVFGWLVIDGGIVSAAERRPPWALGSAVALAALGGTYWFFAVQPDFAVRTIVVSLPGISFDIYAAIACLRMKAGRRAITLRIMAGMLLLLAASNVLKAWFIAEQNIQVLFTPDWQLGQFYLASVVSTVVGTVLFVLLATQQLQERLDQKLDEHRQTGRQLKLALEQAERFRVALDNVPAYVYMKNRDLRYTYANRPTLELFGCSREELVNHDDSSFFPPDTVVRLRQVDRLVLGGTDTREEIDIPDAPGGRRVYLEVKTPVYGDQARTEITGLCGISTDITAMKEHEKELEYVAHNDALTGLPNRVLLSDRLAQALASNTRRGLSVAVVFMDLDGFKAVNDQHGHGAGDQLLIEVSRRMGEVLRDGDTLARLGGDEFVAVLADLENPDDCNQILDRLLKAASSPVKIGELAVQVSVSIGVTLHPEDNSDADQLLRHADQAMYRAKQAGKNCYRKYVERVDAA